MTGEQPPDVAATPPPVLQTARLVLRRFGAGDVDAYAALVGDAEVMAHIGDGRPVGAEAAWAQLAYVIGHWELRGHGPFAVVRRGDGAVIGRVGTLHPVDLDQPELAWLLARGSWGQGYGREAVAAARDWALGAAGMAALVSWVAPGNHRARRLAETLGAVPASDGVRHGRRFVRYRFERPGGPAG